MAPRLVVDRAGRFCLAFLSDRGQLRNYATYTCWSHDLEHWSRPVLVTPAYHADHDFIQARDGRYLLVAAESKAGEYTSALLRTSPDLIQWDEPVDVQPRFEGMYLVRLVQDGAGRYHFAFALNNVSYASSADLQQWTENQELPEHGRPANLLLAAVGQEVIIGSSQGDGYYSGVDNLQLTAKRPRDQAWRKLPRPANTIDVLFNAKFDPERREFLFLWQTLNMSLDPVLPSGPVYAMTACPAGWPGVKEEKKETAP